MAGLILTNWILCPSGVCPAGSYPLCCGLPAHSGHWHGYHAGENHHHQEGFNHICAGKKEIEEDNRRHCNWLQKMFDKDCWCIIGSLSQSGHLCASWWFDWPCPRHHLRSLGRHNCVVPRHRWAGYLPRCRPPGLHLPYHGPQHCRSWALRCCSWCAENPSGLFFIKKCIFLVQLTKHSVSYKQFIFFL